MKWVYEFMKSVLAYEPLENQTNDIFSLFAIPTLVICIYLLSPNLPSSGDCSPVESWTFIAGFGRQIFPIKS